MSQSKHLHALKNETITEILNVNLMSAIALSKALVTSWVRSIRNYNPEHPQEPLSHCIINVSSVLASKGGAGATVYAASKAGLIGFTRALAQEVGSISKKYRTDYFHPSFRVNAVIPGYIGTRMTGGLSIEAKRSIEEQIPLGRMGNTDEVADALMVLIENEYANNCILNLDGGLSAT